MVCSPETLVSYFIVNLEGQPLPQWELPLTNFTGVYGPRPYQGTRCS